ncbi:MAG: hypothetical protein QXY52_03690 [Conexivisphaerales archaeon]
MTGASAPNGTDYRWRCAELEGRLVKLEMENKELREENFYDYAMHYLSPTSKR